jgi:hypothetical protein
MSSKTRTRTAHATVTTGTARALPSLPDQPTTATVRTDTEDKLWTALHANPHNTAAYLSNAARIGKSTAQKILVKWADEGSVTRTPGTAEGRRRAADVWAISPTDTTDICDDSVVTPTDTTIADAMSTEPVNGEPTAAPVSDDAHDTTDAIDDAVPTTAGPAVAESTITEATKPAEDTTPNDTTQSVSAEVKDEKAERLAPGALRGMVEDWLRDHPSEQAGPTRIAKDLAGKSGGAVSNALDKLVADGVAVKTQDKPRRFALAPAQQAAAAPAN